MNLGRDDYAQCSTISAVDLSPPSLDSCTRERESGCGQDVVATTLVSPLPDMSHDCHLTLRNMSLDITYKVMWSCDLHLTYHPRSSDLQ